jgi:exosome complex exonuclease DIS3/RRP44
LEACKLSATADAYLVIDTNVALHQVTRRTTLADRRFSRRPPCSQLDFLESPLVNDVVVLGVVQEEVRKRNAAAHARLRALLAAPSRRFFAFANEHHAETRVAAVAGESPNDRNDRAIRSAVAFYARVVPSLPVILLTEDAACRALAQAEGLRALSCSEYAQSRGAESAALSDLVARVGSEEAADEDEDGAAGRPGGAKRARLFAEHAPLSELTRRLREGTLLQGPLRVSRFSPWEARLAREGGDEVLILGREDMNRAMEGDVVAVELLPRAQWRAPSSRLPQPAAPGDDGEAEAAAQVAPGEHYGGEAVVDGAQPTGRVVGVLRRAWRERGYAGSLDPPSAGRRSGAGASWELLIPADRRFPKIRIRTRQAAALADQRLVVVIDSWEASSAYPSGHYVRSLGACGDREAETLLLVHEHDIDTRPFSEAVHACVPPLPWRVPASALAEAGREDLRHLRVCSVDPPGCRDIDDALHCRRLAGDAERWECGVHIADVTAFLRPGSAMDEEASRRGTSTYLVQRRIDMLPKALTEDICSLRGGEERLTFSCLWTMDGEANVLDVRFTKAVIRSAAALSYQEAQARMDDAGACDPLTCDLRQLNALAKRLRARRAASGALQLASPEVKFALDSETLDPLDVGMYEVREANQMVEEFMLLANCAVAAKILAAFPACSLLRRHPAPSQRMLEPLMRAAACAGLQLDGSSSAALGASLDCARRSSDPYFNKLLRIMATRCMTQALYACSGLHSPKEFVHYGLAAPLYTHFTSPIRRYADVLVHRLLAAALGLQPLPPAAAAAAALGLSADSLNTRHRNAQQAGRASVELHTLLFFRSRPRVADARVTRCRANGLIVFVPKYGLEGPLLFADDAATQGDWQLAADGAAVAREDGSARYALFDRLAVRIAVETSPSTRRERLVLRLASLAELHSSEVAKP